MPFPLSFPFNHSIVISTEAVRAFANGLAEKSASLPPPSPSHHIAVVLAVDCFCVCLLSVPQVSLSCSYRNPTSRQSRGKLNNFSLSVSIFASRNPPSGAAHYYQSPL